MEEGEVKRPDDVMSEDMIDNFDEDKSDLMGELLDEGINC